MNGMIGFNKAFKNVVNFIDRYKTLSEISILMKFLMILKKKKNNNQMLSNEI